MVDQLKGFNSIHSYFLSSNIQDAIVEWLDWGLLEKGNYFNVTKGELATNGEDMSRLRLSSNDSYASGQVWEGFRKNWVWQSGVSGVGIDPPIVGNDPNNPGISGIYINNQFEPTSGVGTYAHTVDYFNGRVIFDSPIPTGSIVQAEFSYKYINVVYANSVPWLREVQMRTQRPETGFLDINQGKWDLPPETRLQLPAVAVEVVPGRKLQGYQLGGGQWITTQIMFHCIAEDEITRNNLVDIISFQNDATVFTFDSNVIAENGAYPLDHRGSPNPSALLYPELIGQYGAGCFFMENSVTEGMDVVSPDLYGGMVRFTTRGIKANI